MKRRRRKPISLLSHGDPTALVEAKSLIQVRNRFHKNQRFILALLFKVVKSITLDSIWLRGFYDD